jgi:hypothetical protein
MNRSSTSRFGLFLVGTIAAAAIAAGCQTSPVAPTVTPGPTIPAVQTIEPYRWDAREELLPWVTAGISTGAVEVSGEGLEAVIRVDVSQRSAKLHGPDCDPMLDDIREARVRYRWIGAGTSDTLVLTLYPRPIEFGQTATVPAFRPSSSATLERSGEWIERSLTPVVGYRPPFSVRFAMLVVDGNRPGGAGRVSGIVEIDWIALVR